MAGSVKQFTNLTGLVVCHNPKVILNRVYKRTSKILAKMPEHSAYRAYTEEIIRQRSAIINSTDDVKAMEQKIGCGLIEEVIEQAKNELTLAENFLLSRPWENLVSTPPPNQWKWPVK